MHLDRRHKKTKREETAPHSVLPLINIKERTPNFHPTYSDDREKKQLV